MKQAKPQARFALCLDSGGNDDLIPRKLYQMLSDERAAADGLLRVVDESGEDYLYPAELFVFVDLPREAERMLTAVA